MFKETIECIDWLKARLITMRNEHPNIEDCIPYSLGALVNATNPDSKVGGLFIVPSVEDREERNKLGIIAFSASVACCMPELSNLRRQMMLKGMAKRAKAIGWNIFSDDFGFTEKMTEKTRFFPSAVILAGEAWSAPLNDEKSPSESPDRESVFTFVWREFGDVPKFFTIPFTMNGDGVVVLGKQTEPIEAMPSSTYFECALNLPLFYSEAFG